jgi:hypothetical protein
MIEAGGVPLRHTGRFFVVFAGINRHSALSCHRDALAR